MRRYKILKKGLFESTTNFEERLNGMCLEGWKAVSISSPQGNQIIVLLEKA